MKNFKKICCMILLLTFIFVFGCSNNNQSLNSAKLSSEYLKIHYIDVGQGDSELIQFNGKNILIDAGPNSNTDRLISYLNKQNIKKLDIVVASHPDEDHIGGMARVINQFTIGEFWAPKRTNNTKTFENMINSLKSKNLKINTAKSGLTLSFDKAITVDIIAPNNDNYDSNNNYSIVIKLTYGNNSFLFVGDAEKISEKEILDKKYNISSDVLKIGHHGSRTSSSKEFLDKVNPKIAVISCGKNNDYGHPNKETLTELTKRKFQIYRTDIDGTIILLSDGKTIKKLN